MVIFQKSSRPELQFVPRVPKQNLTENYAMGNLDTKAVVIATIDAPLFLRMRAVTRFTGLGRSTIYRLVAQDKFPSPVRLANRAVAWRRTDLELWSQGRPSTHH